MITSGTKFEKFRKECYSSKKQEKRRKFENRAIYLNKIKDQRNGGLQKDLW